MPGRNPEAQERSRIVGDEIRQILDEKRWSQAELRRALIDAGHDVPNDMWLVRRLAGRINLVKPVRVVYGPTDDLQAIAKVLDVDPERLVRVINPQTADSA